MKSKDEIKGTDKSYKNFKDSSAGRDLLEFLENQEAGAIQSAKSGVGYMNDGGENKQVQLTDSQQLGMLQRAHAYGIVKSYIERRASK